MFIRTENFREFLKFYPVVSFIIIIQLILWVLISFVPFIGEWIYAMGIGWNGLVAQGQYWRVVTPIFLHADFPHLIFNSFSLVLFAPALEVMLGKLKFLVAYLGTGIIANVLTFIVEPSFNYVHLGASGAIFGLFGLYIFMIFFEKQLIDPQNARIILIIAGIGLVMTFFRANINISGHIFGFIAGFAFGPILLRNVKPFSPVLLKRRVRNQGDIGFDPNRWNKKRNRYKPYLKPILYGILIVLMLLGVLSSIL
ncbi:rhomboid family intramembrane serine protease [Gracilibacillus caseinilyticus]|uniref:Rhomboid family intramembrane serine protease n=1 Tax=Gracilibacillus caseinilyticus TaxID=2932256 RepID=A0ABY4EXI7_9BACI|nr:rhomboid family intramembrane serine protease [Gracilibacillus caseinilyticus]UOQ49132.1 rhomboid family intramembrane serine protease [Gracilibacillus caseinilyticus]